MADVDRIEDALRDLGASLDVPPPSRPAGAVAAAVAGRLRGEQRRRRRIVSATVAAAVAAAAGILLAVLPLTHDRSVPLASSSQPAVEVRLAARFGLGEPLDLLELQRAAPFPVLLPTAAGFASPDEVYFRRDYPTDSVSLVYHADGRPDVAAVLTEFLGSPGGLADSLVASGADAVTVNDNPGAWVRGRPPVFFYFDPDGRAREVPANLRANTLVWQHGELTIRFETDLGRAEAVKVAESIQFRDFGQPAPRIA